MKSKFQLAIFICILITSKTFCQIEVKKLRGFFIVETWRGKSDTVSFHSPKIRVCDFNFYKNLGFIHFVESKDLDMRLFKNFDYRCKLQAKWGYIHFYTEPSTIKEYFNDENIILSDDIISAIKNNEKTAEYFDKQISPKIKKLRFSKNVYRLYTICSGEISVIELPKQKQWIQCNSPRKEYLEKNYFIIWDEKTQLSVFEEVIIDGL